MVSTFQDLIFAKQATQVMLIESYVLDPIALDLLQHTALTHLSICVYHHLYPLLVHLNLGYLIMLEFFFNKLLFDFCEILSLLVQSIEILINNKYFTAF